MRYFMLIYAFIFILGCQSKGTFEDFAHVRQAEKTLTEIRNALEAYKVDHGAYPGPDADLKEVLAFHFSRPIITEHASAPKHTGNIAYAKKRIENMYGILQEFYGLTLSYLPEEMRGKVDSQLAKVMHCLRKYEAEVDLVPFEDTLKVEDPISIVMDVYDKLNKMAPAEQEATIREALLRRATRLATYFDSMKSIVDVVTDTTKLEDYRKNMEILHTLFKRRWAELMGKRVEDTITTTLDEAARNLDELQLDSLTYIEMKTAIDSFRNMEAEYAKWGAIKKGWEGMQRLRLLLDQYQQDIRPMVHTSAIMAKARLGLLKIKDEIEDYRRINGRYPPEEMFDSLRRKAFIEITMGGEVVDYWPEYSIAYAEGPYYELIDTLTQFRVYAYANDPAKSYVYCEVKLKNMWDKVVSTFFKGPIYETPDSTKTYFLKAWANDRGHTLVVARPPTHK